MMGALFFSPTKLRLNFGYSWHAFQTAKRCVSCENFLHESCSKYQINPFFKFVIIKTQLITRYYNLVLRETLNFHLHLYLIFRAFKHQCTTLLHAVWGNCLANSIDRWGYVVNCTFSLALLHTKDSSDFVEIDACEGHMERLVPL